MVELPIWKILVKIGNDPQMGMKMKSIWNHQLVKNWRWMVNRWFSVSIFRWLLGSMIQLLVKEMIQNWVGKDPIWRAYGFLNWIVSPKRVETTNYPPWNERFAPENWWLEDDTSFWDILEWSIFRCENVSFRKGIWFTEKSKKHLIEIQKHFFWKETSVNYLFFLDIFNMHNFERQMCRIFNMCTASIQTNSGSSLIVTLIKIARSLPNLEPQQGMTLMLHYSTLFFSRSWSLDIFLQRAVNNQSMSGQLSTSN